MTHLQQRPSLVHEAFGGADRKLEETGAYALRIDSINVTTWERA